MICTKSEAAHHMKAEDLDIHLCESTQTIKTLEILYEDNHLIALNKPVGIPSQSDQTGVMDLRTLLMKDIKVRYDKPGNVYCGLIHRLDRPTSGVIVFAKTQKALSRMAKLFRDRDIQKSYLCVTSHIPSPFSGRLTHHLFKDRSKNKSYVTKPTGDSKEAILSYELLQQQGERCLVAVYPETGRSHQIRVQMAHINCPIVGDRKYGGDHLRESSQFGLHAHKIKFEHPVKKETVEITAPWPENDPWTAFEAL